MRKLFVILWLTFILNVGLVFTQKGVEVGPCTDRIIFSDLRTGNIIMGCKAEAGRTITWTMDWSNGEKIFADDLAVIPIRRGNIANAIHVGYAVNRKGILYRFRDEFGERSVGKWSIAPADTIISATETEVMVANGSDPEFRRYRFTRDGELMTLPLGSGPRFGYGCSSFARTLRGDEFCVSQGYVYRAEGWPVPKGDKAFRFFGSEEVLISKVVAVGDDLYVLQPSSPFASGKLLKLTTGSLSEPLAVEEVFTDRGIEPDSPMTVIGDWIYLVLGHVNTDVYRQEILRYNHRNRNYEIYARWSPSSVGAWPLVGAISPY